MNINSYILAGVSFLAGAAVSGVVTWFAAKKRYERIHREEMDAVWADVQGKKKASKSTNELKSDEMIYPDPTDKPDLFEMAAKIQQEEGYYNPDNIPTTDDTIYEITANDLDEDRYKRIDLTYYADGILADDGDYPVRDLKNTVGENFAALFKNRDEIFIRNEKFRIDYDIVISQLTYGEMLDRSPETQQRVDYADAMDEYYENADEEESDEEEDDDDE